MGFGGRRLGRLEVDPDAVRIARDDLLRFFPQLAGGGSRMPGAGRSTSPPPICRSSGAVAAVHHGFGFTGNGVGPAYLGGEILARLALDRRDELTRLALVDPSRS